MGASTQGLAAANAWMRYAIAYSQMSMAAGEVIFRRTVMMSHGTMSSPEAVGMVMEKLSAFSTSTEKATIAAAKGGNALKIASAALRPIRAKTRSNLRKLRG